MPPPAVRIIDRLAASQVTAVEALCTAAAAADGIAPLSEHVLLHLRHGGEGPDRHLLADVDGELAGYAHLDPTDPVEGPAAELVVHPDHRGLGVGGALLDAVIGAATRAAPRTGHPVPLRLWAHGGHPAARALAASRRFVIGRRLEQWRRGLLDLPPAEPLPEGLRVRAFHPGADDDAWLALNAAAFADHPEQGGWTRADLAARLAEEWFDPSGFLLAERPDGTLAGFHWTKVHGALHHTHPHSHDADHPTHTHAHQHDAIGEVYVVGVDPAEHGRGLGRALTLAGLHWLRAAGLDTAMLYVDGDNTAAQAVYRRLGFRPHAADVMFYRWPSTASDTRAVDTTRTTA